MIWEVDEDCDKAVNWEEFQASLLEISAHVHTSLGRLEGRGWQKTMYIDVAGNVSSLSKRQNRFRAKEALQRGGVLDE